MGKLLLRSKKHGLKRSRCQQVFPCVAITESVQAQIERWDRRQSDVAAAVQASRSQQARGVYEQSVQHRARAGELLAADDLELALRQIKVALDMLHEAGELTR